MKICLLPAGKAIVYATRLVADENCVDRGIEYTRPRAGHRRRSSPTDLRSASIAQESGPLRSPWMTGPRVWRRHSALAAVLVSRSPQARSRQVQPERRFRRESHFCAPGSGYLRRCESTECRANGGAHAISA